jgi:hypothetical protein
MGRIKSNLIELFIDKAVMAAAIIAALVILLFFVISSPNSVEYGGENHAPGQIDEFINRKAATIQEQLKKAPQDSNSYEPKMPLYLSLIKDSIKDVNTNINFPLPGYSTGAVTAENRTYQLPTIEQAKKPSTAVVTMAAYVPTEELTDAVTYDKAETKLADMDIVTVETSINAKQLYESFHSALAGKNIAEKLEEQYARPVFAKVELQRRTLLGDGSWSQWTEVPRTKICPKKVLQLPTGTNEYEIQIAMVQFAKFEIRDEVLQPPVYDNAIPAEKWLSPSLYNEREKRLEKEKEELRRQQLEAERAGKMLSKTRPPTGRRQPPTGGPPGGIEGGTGRETPAPPGGITQPPTRQPTRPTPVPRQPQPKTKLATPATAEKKQALTEEQKFNEILLTDKTNIGNLEKLVFWAHDDTAKPSEKYQYRIRIGVFNPIAGKPWFSEEQKDLQDQVVLFGIFSEPTETIEIPNKLYFFATDMREAKKSNIVDKTVEIKVARYTLGNWVSETFSIKAGEQIGTVSDKAKARLEKAGIQTEPVDLATGYVMIDTRPVTEWTGTGFLKSKDFYELLYCKTGQAIATMPIKERFWPEEIAKVYKEIEQAEAAEPIVLLTREQIRGGTRIETRRISSEPGPAPSPESETEGSRGGRM